RLARDIFGIGFLTADKIAQSMGLAPDSPQRVAAGVAYALNQGSDEGHVFLPTDELVQQAAELLSVSPEQAALGILRLQRDDQIKIAPPPGSPARDHRPTPTPAEPVTIPQLLAEPGQLYAAATVEQAQQLLKNEEAIYLTPLYYTEVGVANRLSRLLSEGTS